MRSVMVITPTSIAPPHLILITGIMAAGKSTVAQRLAEQRTERDRREPSGARCQAANDQYARENENQLRGNPKRERRGTELPDSVGAGERGRVQEDAGGSGKTHGRESTCPRFAG